MADGKRQRVIRDLQEACNRFDLIESNGPIWDSMEEIERAVGDLKQFGGGPIHDGLEDASGAARQRNGERLASACRKFLNLWQGNESSRMAA